MQFLHMVKQLLNILKILPQFYLACLGFMKYGLFQSGSLLARS